MSSRVLLCGALLLWASGAGAGPLTDLLQARQAKIDALLARYPDPLPEAARRELQAAVGDLLDYGAMAEAALGAAEWQRRSAAQREAFSGAFEALLRASSIRSVDVYRVSTVRYEQERVAGAAGEVRASVESDAALTEMDYRFRRLDGRWRVVDYAIDGLWAAQNYQRQFQKVLAEHGWEELLERMRRRTAELEAEP